MVRSSVVSAVSVGLRDPLAALHQIFWSTNFEALVERKAPGSLATPCVDQLVLSTQKAEPQEL